MTTALTDETMERLSTYENFQFWSFGRLEAALQTRIQSNEYLRKDSMGFRARGMLPPVPDDDGLTGPWDGEPDKIQWIDPTSGYDCLIVRNHMGALCGYVGVPPGHPFHGIEYGSCTRESTCDEDGLMAHCEHSPEDSISVHGGLTFSDFCQPGEPVDGICHRAAPGRPDKVWWLGFDCGHAWDIIPGMGYMLHDNETSSYKDVAFVANEITDEAAQLKFAELETRVTAVEIAQAVQSITSDGRP